MASKLTVEQFAAEVARALGARLVALLLYGSWARGTHVPDRSDVNTLLICDTVDDALFATLAPAMRAWTRAGHPAPLILSEREWRGGTVGLSLEHTETGAGRGRPRWLYGRRAGAAGAARDGRPGAAARQRGSARGCVSRGGGQHRRLCEPSRIERG